MSALMGWGGMVALIAAIFALIGVMATVRRNGPWARVCGIVAVGLALLAYALSRG